MTDWKNDLKILADKLRTEQKNKKGLQSKFSKVVGYKKKLGFSSTGIPLTARAAKQLQRNRAAYKGKKSNYEGTTLQQINEERAAAGNERWKHLKPGSRHSSDRAPTKKQYSSSELIWRSSATKIGGLSWYNSPTTFKGLGYEDPPQEEKESVNYIAPVETKKDPGADYKEGRFPKLDEAIRNAKRGKR